MSLVIVHCREIKEFQSKALECLAASQVSYEEINPIVASTPLSVHWVGVGGAESLTVPAPLSLQGGCSATPGSTASNNINSVLPTFIFYTDPPVLSGVQCFVTVLMLQKAAWSPFHG